MPVPTQYTLIYQRVSITTIHSATLCRPSLEHGQAARVAGTFLHDDDFPSNSYMDTRVVCHCVCRHVKTYLICTHLEKRALGTRGYVRLRTHENTCRRSPFSSRTQSFVAVYIPCSQNVRMGASIFRLPRMVDGLSSCISPYQLHCELETAL